MTRRQASGKFRSTGPAVSASFPAAPLNGSLVTVAICAFTGANPWLPEDITDNQGGLDWRVALSTGSMDNIVIGIFYTVLTTTPSHPFTITIDEVTFGNQRGSGAMVEWSGESWDIDTCLTATSEHQALVSSSATTDNTASIPAGPHAVVAAVSAFTGTDADTIAVETVDPAWTEESEELNFFTYMPGETDSRIVTAGGVQACNWTFNGNYDHTEAIAVFGPLPPQPGGAPPSGLNPAAGALPSSFPLLWLELKVGSTVTAYAETALQDEATYTATVGTGKRKPPKILRISSARRALTREGNFGASGWRVEIADYDLEFRRAAANSTIGNSYCAFYFVDDAVRRAEGVPFRAAAGVVTGHRALPGFRYELEVEDVLGAYFGDAFRQPHVPPHILTIAEFQGLDPAAEGKAGPIALGALTDVAASSPQGVVPAIYMGYGYMGSLTGHSLAANVMVDAWLFCEHAVAEISDIFYNDPTSPTLRHVVPDASYGDILWAPHKPEWTTGTGLTVDYVDYPSGGTVRRYTPMFIDRSSTHAAAARDGRTIISANIYGAEANGDSTGNYFSTPEQMLQHTLVNYVFGEYRTGSYAVAPDFTANSYTTLDASTVAQCMSVGANRLAGGYVGAALIGGDGDQQNGFDLIRDFCQGGDFDIGTNRHGQLIFSREDRSATPVVSFTAQSDILDGEFSMAIDRQRLANKISYQYAPRYLPEGAPRATAAEGDPMPRDPFAPSSNWTSSIRVITATTAIGNYNSKTIPYDFQDSVVRDHDTARSVASFVIARMIGPSSDGPWTFRFATGLQGYGKGSAYVDLGSVIQFEIPERLGTVATSPVIGRVTEFEVDPQAKKVTLAGDVLR